MNFTVKHAHTYCYTGGKPFDAAKQAPTSHQRHRELGRALAEYDFESVGLMVEELLLSFPTGAR